MVRFNNLEVLRRGSRATYDWAMAALRIWLHRVRQHSGIAGSTPATSAKILARQNWRSAYIKLRLGRFYPAPTTLRRIKNEINQSEKRGATICRGISGGSKHSRHNVRAILGNIYICAGRILGLI